jgi:YVTN family beta-propeller protein
MPSSFTPWLHNSQSQQGTSDWSSSASPASTPAQFQAQQPATGWGSFSVNPAAQSQPQPQQPATGWNGFSNAAGSQPQAPVQQGSNGWSSFANSTAAQPQPQTQQPATGWNGFSGAPGAQPQQQLQQSADGWGAFAGAAGVQQQPQMPQGGGGWGAFSNPSVAFANPAGTSALPPQQQVPPGAVYGFGAYAPPMEGSQGQGMQGRPRKPKASKKRRLMIIGIVAVLLVALLGGGALVYRTLKHQHPALTALSTVEDVSLGNGPPTRFDYQSMDPQHNLLLISRSGANSVLLFNIQTRKVIAEVPGIEDGHGLYAIDEVGRIYAAAGGSDQVVVIDLHSYKVLTRINVGKGGGPDGMAYDPVEHLLFVSDETGNNDAVINVQTDKLVKEIPLGGNVGNTQYDPTTDTIYVNVETQNQLDAINPRTLQVVGRYPLTNCNTNHGMSLDSLNRLMFIACTGNATLVEVSMKTMQVTDHASIGNNPDVLSLDQSRHLLYVASESGVVSIFVEQGPTMHKLAEGYIAPHAHTVGVDQQTHLVYLPLENLNGHPVIRIAQYNPPAGS